VRTTVNFTTTASLGVARLLHQSSWSTSPGLLFFDFLYLEKF